MAKKKIQSAGVLTQPPADLEKWALRLRNVSNQSYILTADVPGTVTVALAPQQEQVLPPTWKDSKALRRVLDAHKPDFEVEWVDAYAEARQLPDLSAAPSELTNALTDWERQFARNLTLSSDTDEVVLLIRDTKPSRPTGAGGQQPDLVYTKEKWRQILSLAEWLEKHVQKRARVLKAIAERKDAITHL